MICFIQLTCVPNLLKFKFTDNYNIMVQSIGWKFC